MNKETGFESSVTEKKLTEEVKASFCRNGIHRHLFAGESRIDNVGVHATVLDKDKGYRCVVTMVDGSGGMVLGLHELSEVIHRSKLELGKIVEEEFLKLMNKRFRIFPSGTHFRKKFIYGELISFDWLTEKGNFRVGSDHPNEWHYSKWLDNKGLIRLIEQCKKMNVVPKLIIWK